MGKKILALINIGLGPYCAYWGWQQGGVYVPTVFFGGIVMFIFGVSLLLLKSPKKEPPVYKDIYIKEDEEID
jgi:hypothetical protein